MNGPSARRPIATIAARLAAHLSPRRPSRPSPRRAVALTLSLAAVVVLGGCNGKASRADCTEMLDKYLEMTINADEGLADLSPAEQKAAREMKKALRKGEPSYRRVQDQCETEISKREYRCAMKAPTPETWQACID